MEVFGSGRFGDLGLHARLSQHLHGPMGFKVPTLVQQSAIPLLLSGRDVLVSAPTGTGKTVVYLAPIVHALQAQQPKISRGDGTFALVLVPTRELCIQVTSVAEQLVHRFHWLVPGHVMGGESRAKEKARLRKGITILVATPGRVLDHLQNTSSFRYDNLQWLVLDEADRLLDMGFEKDIEAILALLGAGQHEKKRQHVLLSATLNQGVSRLARISLLEPATVGLPPARNLEPELTTKNSDGEVKLQEPEYDIPVELSQSYVKVTSKVRLVALMALLRHKMQGARSGCKGVVFFSTCHSVDFHHTLLSKFRWSIEEEERVSEAGPERFVNCDIFKLHGNVSQTERSETFHQFCEAGKAILLSTDVAARGLDFEGLSFIVQHDPPGEAVDYVHRVGRTARLGRRGEALLFLQPCEIEYLIELQKHGVVLKELPIQKVLDYIYVGAKKRKRAESEDIAEMHPAALMLQRSLESFVATKEELKRLASDAFRSSIRAYAAHRGSLKNVFQVRKLHLGHVAKSFGLRDAPSQLGKRTKKASSQKRSHKKRRLRSAKMME